MNDNNNKNEISLIETKKFSRYIKDNKAISHYKKIKNDFKKKLFLFTTNFNQE